MRAHVRPPARSGAGGCVNGASAVAAVDALILHGAEGLLLRINALRRGHLVDLAAAVAGVDVVGGQGELDDLADDDFIFGGKKPMTKSRYQNAWLQYCIGIGHAHDSGKRYKTGKKSKDGAPLYKTIMEPDFTAHQLRHEFASTLVQCGISPQVAKELMGHADILTTQRWYAEAKASAVDEATRILNAHFTA